MPQNPPTLKEFKESYEAKAQSVQVKTQYSPDLIVQTQVFQPQSSVYDNMVQRVVRLQEDGIQKALAELGYLHPTKTQKVRDAYNSLRSNDGGTINDLLAVLDEVLEARDE